MFSRLKRRGSRVVVPVEPLEGRQLLANIGQLVLVNADNGQLIGPFENNTTINYAALPANLSVRAFLDGSAGSVRFGMDGTVNSHTENYDPYYLLGENASGLPIAFHPSNGTHTMKVTAFSSSNGGGTAGETMNVTYNVGNAPGSPPSVISGATVSFSDSSADAKEAGLDKGTFVISRTGSTSSSLSVAYNVSGSATNGVDYQALSGSITFPAGKSSVSLIITPKDDSLAEGTENVVITLNPGSSYNVGSISSATCPIFDNDSGSTPPPATGQNIIDITWTSNGVARSMEPRTEAGSIQVGSKIYAIGGFTATGGTGTYYPLTRKVHVYDMITKKWSQLASIPSVAAGNHFGVASDGANIYTVAGQTQDTYGAGTNTVYKYNIASNSWSRFPVDLPEIRFGMAAFVDKGWLHVVGGDKADRKTPTTTHWAIDLNNTSAGWQTKAPMPLAGDHVAHATVNGKIYIIGGEHGHHGLSPGDENGYIQHNYTFEYDPANDTWKRKADMPFGTSHLEGNTLAINGKIIQIGGVLTGGGTNIMNKVHVFDPVANTWKLLPTKYPKRVLGSESGYLNGKIYIVDGYSPDSSDRSKGYEGTVKFG